MVRLCQTVSVNDSHSQEHQKRLDLPALSRAQRARAIIRRGQQQREVIRANYHYIVTRFKQQFSHFHRYLLMGWGRAAPICGRGEFRTTAFR